MKIQVATQKNEDISLNLERKEILFNDIVSHFIWEGQIFNVFLKIHQSITGSLEKIEKHQDIITPDVEIISQFNEQKEIVNSVEAAGIEYPGDEDFDEDLYPYDPDLIRVDPRPYQVSLVHELINDGDIDLAPDFQRHFVWKDIAQRSKLIESMMLRIPLPVFYMAQDAEGKFQVVDGLQRLTVINQFLNNEFRLKKLEYLKDCEGKYFKKEGEKNNLDPKYVRRITQTQLSFNIIDPQTPTRVKFDIFRRINQGGKPLNHQEIRNCMASIKVRNILKNLATSDEFRKATNYSVNSTRMEDQELVLRFIGFFYSEYINTVYFKYSGYMREFLDEVIDILNRDTEQNYAKIIKAFLRAMINAEYLFGPYAFRKCGNQHIQPGARRQLINKSLFTTWSVLLSQYEPMTVKTKTEKCSLVPHLAFLIDGDREYFDALTNGTNDIKRIDFAFNVGKRILEQHL